MYQFVKRAMALVCILAILAPMVGAQPYYQSIESYENGIGGLPSPDGPINSKLPFSKGASAVPGPPDLDAIWSGATQWMTGINFGGETFGGSIAKGENFFNTGSTILDDQYVPIRIIFQTGAPNQTLCQVFRRDLGYASVGVGTFPGSAWDISDPDNPRRLNMCFSEDNNAAVANNMWDPNGTTGGNWPGKREYVFIMLSSYDGTGLTYAGFNINSGMSSMDVLCGWWPLVAGGHTFFENQPCTLTINAYYVTDFTVIVRESDTDKEVDLSWNYVGTAAVDSFLVFRGTTSPATTQIAALNGTTFAYTDATLSLGQEYYYRVDAKNNARAKVGASKELRVPAEVAENLNFVGHWDERSLYGGCWGYTDPVDDKEYALLACRNEGISIIDINVDPPVEVGFMPLVNFGNDSKEVKVYGDYAIVISEFEPTQIFDISDVTNPVKVSDVFNETDDGSNGAHNCMVVGNYLIVIGNHVVGEAEIFDISNPAAPVNVADLGSFYYHDIDVVNDTLIGFGIYGNGMDIWDITNKSEPDSIGHFNYPGSGAHNGEFLQGTSFIAIGDEIGSTGNHTRMFDLRDLNNIDYIYDIIVDANAVAHNCYARNDTLYIAHYSEGIRMWDVSDPFNPVELGYYDSYLPAQYGYVGVWNVFPFFASGKVIASDMQSGLFVLQPSGPPPDCCTGIRGDFNGDSNDANILDLNYCVNRIFRGGP
ncbi:MAG TPA: choice-of-anchor B family protein, partial [candidate division Zixibacteria bacterium]|nr:choice-of-anchor B family protein [candidate division Zixibacteria bacterium]